MSLEEALLLDTLSCRFNYLRETKKLTQEEVSQNIDVPLEQYITYEAGDCLPGLVTLLNVAAFYNVSTDYLLGQTETPQRKR